MQDIWGACFSISIFWFDPPSPWEQDLQCWRTCLFSRAVLAWFLATPPIGRTCSQATSGLSFRPLLKLRIVKERAPENEPRIQLGVNSLKVDTYQTWLYIIGVSLQICLLIGPASAPYSPPPPRPLYFTFYFFVYCVRNKNLFSLFKP